MKFHPPNQKFTKLYQKFFYRFAGKMILLLTTRGRKTGKPHTIGLQYEYIDGRYYVGAADGAHADWYHNLQNDPIAKIQQGERLFTANAELVDDVERIADFLQYRLRRRPLMVGLILRMDGIKGKPVRQELLKYASRIRLVILTPSK